MLGLPVVTSPHGGQIGYIRDGENGFIVDPGDTEMLAHAMCLIMENPALALEMGAARHEEDRAYFRPERTAEAFLEIYLELLG